MQKEYGEWLSRGRFTAWGDFKRSYFCVAVGGGNTVKAHYRALIEHHHTDIDWIAHVRFFFLEESTGEKHWQSATEGLVSDFITPLALQLIKHHGTRKIARSLSIPSSADPDEVIRCMVRSMVFGIDLGAASRAMVRNNHPQALRMANKELCRYELDLKKKLGPSCEFHLVISGIGKDGTLGALPPYRPELKQKEPGLLLLKLDNGALRIALNRGILINAECILLIVSGNLKLTALGRFEMEESTNFEQTVQETPLRMLRETPDIAEKVYIFADEQALHFEETVFTYRDKGVTRQHKAETREGNEPHGIHILLMHGFMGLFSFTSFLIRLPSAWTVSALHRGSHAKSLGNDDIFPHYANGLRHAILRNWREGRPSPVAGHSIAGLIIDHLLLSITGDYAGPIPKYQDLAKENKQLVDALRAGGLIQMATWAPTDGPHAGANVKSAVSHYRNETPLNYTPFEKIYKTLANGRLHTAPSSAVSANDRLHTLNWILKQPGAETIIGSMNAGIRFLLNKRQVQQKLLNRNSPYVLRLVGGRLLKKVSFFGLCKEVNAALHNPVEYQRRHLKALDILLAYDIPLLSIVHEDDFLVSAQRHTEEHAYILQARMRKEGVEKEQDLRVTTRYVLLQREQTELPMDPLNPHLMTMSTSMEGNSIARQITLAITSFVNENVAKAITEKTVKPLASVRSWRRRNASKKA